MPTPSIDPRRFILRDGSPVLVRPIVPEDKVRLVEGLARLSERSRYYRFMTAVVRLTEQQLHYLTEIDYAGHMAWIALDPTVPGEPLLGVGRYIRIEGEPEVAEAAVAVVDSHQGRGLGTLLLGLLALSAVRNRIHHFRAYVLAENLSMLRIFLDLGATARREANLHVVDMAIPEDPRDLPDTPAGRVFKAVAREALPPPGPRPQVEEETVPDRFPHAPL